MGSTVKKAFKYGECRLQKVVSKGFDMGVFSRLGIIGRTCVEVQATMVVQSHAEKFITLYPKPCTRNPCTRKEEGSFDCTCAAFVPWAGSTKYLSSPLHSISAIQLSFL